MLFNFPIQHIAAIIIPSQYLVNILCATLYVDSIYELFMSLGEKKVDIEF
jgi:hypothetical protein